ncbi:MAG: hypothetical protein FWC68_00445 [Oscillospiraceae bacterium]|nr:hypothetical protein [Oscillospiraceae bacterium]
MNSKTRNILIISTIIVLFTIIGISAWMLYNRHFSENQKIYRAVRNHVRTYGENVVSLGELTEFEWEQAVYFSRTANPLDIYEAVGVQFHGSMDLSRGIIFINDGEIVYYEYFPWKGYGISVHMYDVRLTMDAQSRMRVRVFEREDIFEVGVILSEERGWRGQTFGDLYWMRAIETEQIINEVRSHNFTIIRPPERYRARSKLYIGSDEEYRYYIQNYVNRETYIEYESGFRETVRDAFYGGHVTVQRLIENGLGVSRSRI